MITAIAVFAMVFAAGAILFETSSNTEGATSYIHGDTNMVGVGDTLTYQIMYLADDGYDTLNLTYTAVLNDSSGNAQSGAVSPSTGSLTSGVESTLTITAPSTAGTYSLVVTFTEVRDSNPAVTTVKTQTVTVVNPIVLSATLMNNSNVDFTNFAVYFKVDGQLIDGSKQLVTAPAGQTAPVSYNWVAGSLSTGKHTFQVVAGSENIGGGQASFTGGEGTFYIGHSDYGLLNILLVVLLIIIVFAVVYFYRKPIKNYGKPKSRR